ncbi:hypothetical protein [Dictyobacter aurantiacus]|uniref:Uncharacterized protein n=1 Tax=Dictyobacter aurantiacus TaxID=1936993 RepID=A0A401ZJ60_9CHLR|nr:hypothetical protein [Dictyobacter aurantiacus]GCE06868.1 hypothetical protein KDAU_41970 [Dictyobacter aurantiacus]
MMTLDELPQLLKRLDQNAEQVSGRVYRQALVLLKPYGLTVYYDERLRTHVVILREKFLFANTDFDINSDDRDNLL